MDYILRARATNLKPPSRANDAEAVSLLEHALALDPRSVAAKSNLAAVLAGRVMDDMTDTPAADLQRAQELAAQALASAPNYPSAHFARGHLLRALGRPGDAIPEYEAVIALNRNAASAYPRLGWCKLMTGSIDETIPLVERTIRLSPRDPYLGLYFLYIGVAHLLQSRTDEAIIWLEKARSGFPAFPNNRAVLASAYALKGETERAGAELAEARRLSADDRFSDIAHLRAAGAPQSASGYWGVPKIAALFEATYFAGLRKAGMPEE
jgi:tetratricopeptide (TPR) repeat protein